MIDPRRATLARYLEDLRKNDGWNPFQHFVIGLLHHAGYTDVRPSNVRSDFGRDAVAITPDGKRCVVAVSFECTKAKVLKDAKRAMEDPNGEDASVLLFVTTASPAQTTWSKWKPEIKKLDLEMRMFHLESILDVATRDDVWRETCARLGLSGERPGFRLITPYDSDQLRAVLQLRPAEWLAKRIELREWAQLSGELRNRLILGKPGAGKTTTLFVHLQATRPDKLLVVEPDLREDKVEALLDAASGGGVIVFDDAHERPNELRALFSALRARQRDVQEVAKRFRAVRLLLAARGQEWEMIQPPFSLTELQDLNLTPSSQITLGRLTREQCHALALAFVTQWGVQAGERVLNRAATIAATADATPLYVLSMLTPSRLEKRLHDKHLNQLPPTVLEIWQESWSRKLSATEQGVLRLVKIFMLTRSPLRAELFDAAAKAFSLNPHEVSHGSDLLEKKLWISRDFEVPTCLDVQLEAVELDAGDFRRWDEFLAQLSTDPVTQAQLHNGTGEYYVHFYPKPRTSDEFRKALRSAEGHFKAFARIPSDLAPAWRALASYNLSLVYSALMLLERSRADRGAWLQKALESVENAVQAYQEEGLQGGLAMARNTASTLYFELAGMARTREDRIAALQTAVQAGEEAVSIYRALGFMRAMAISRRNVAIRYLELARLEETRTGAEAWLQKSVESVEEALQIFRELGLTGDFAMALTSAGNVYYHKALLEKEETDRSPWLQKAADVADEAMNLYREMDVPAELSLALGTNGRIYQLKALHSGKRRSRLAFLHASLEFFLEAVDLHREAPDAALLLLLGGTMRAYLDLAKDGDIRSPATVRATYREGVDLARAMEDEVSVTFFNESMRQFNDYFHTRCAESRFLQHPSPSALRVEDRSASVLEPPRPLR